MEVDGRGEERKWKRGNGENWRRRKNIKRYERNNRKKDRMIRKIRR